MANTHDAIIIGSGQGGTPLARELAGAGWKTALIEREHVAGTCINEGCTPTKTMVASARVAYLARRAKDYGVNTGAVTVDMARVRRRKQAVVDDFRGSNERKLVNAQVDWVKGEGRFVDAKTVEVKLNDGGSRTLSADKIFINTGARPNQPSIKGLDSVAYLNSTSIMELETLPEHLLIIGGGYIGVEFGQMFRRFGSRVTIVQRAERLLGREDPDVADEVAKILSEDGIEMLLNTNTSNVEAKGDGVRLHVQTPDGDRAIDGSHLLVAVGRTPNTEALNLDRAGVKIDRRGFVPVNDRLETNVPGIYAIGDVNGGPAFTHISYDDFRILRDNLLKGESNSRAGRLLPYVVFMDPQLGRIGLSEQDARAQDRNIRVARIPMSWVARAIEMDETRGLMKAIVDADTQLILGGAILGIEGGELMAILQTAMMGRLPYTVLQEAIFAHPTLTEAFNTLFTSME
jgi:pyruvate/2-oxoglutarate dehydrogenase complex dihydrolipoamide dehydrogenase (E3) component